MKFEKGTADLISKVKIREDISHQDYEQSISQELIDMFMDTEVMIDDSDNVVAAYGITFIAPGTGQVWSRFSEDVISKHIKMLVRRLKFQIDRVQRENDLSRIQVQIDSDNEVHCRWIEMLGFKFESRMVKYNGDRDVSLYVRIY